MSSTTVSSTEHSSWGYVQQWLVSAGLANENLQIKAQGQYCNLKVI